MDRPYETGLSVVYAIHLSPEHAVMAVLSVVNENECCHVWQVSTRLPLWRVARLAMHDTGKHCMANKYASSPPAN